MQDTIAAISTPSGTGAVGIVRMSGTEVKNILSKLWVTNSHPVDKFETYRFYYGKLSAGRPIDNVLAVYMSAPNSYTGEDVVEIHCHGGSLATKGVLEAVLAAGARLASPGEFTRRAFLNGKMDLAQAESVAEVIGATSERAYRLAQEHLAGRFSEEIRGAQEALKGLKAFVEAAVDFPEEDIEFIEHEKTGEKVEALVKKLDELASTYDEGRLSHDGVRVVIVGKPNVGKSSILNALAGMERAIVHRIPGTTRDTIEETVELGGVVFKLADTAGIRDSGCEVEKMGIDRARIKMSDADLALVGLDESLPFDKDDGQILEETLKMKRIIILNKQDLVEQKRDEETIDFDDTTKKIATSTVTGQGMAELKKMLVDFVCADISGAEGVIVTNLRHKTLLDSAISHLRGAKKAVLEQESAEFVAYHLQRAMDSLGGITGEVTTEDVLDEIFSKFCIGK